jgi:hypothetical protein
MKVFMAVWFIVLAIMTTIAAIDVLGHRGWGYHPSDVWGGLLMMVFGVPALGVFMLIQSVVEAWTRRIYGPDPLDKKSHDDVG